jgi:hypothetical protein
MFFHQLIGASGMDSEEIGHSTLETPSEMSIEVSLFIVGNMADVMTILARKLIIKEAYFFILFTIVLQDTASSKVIQRRVESIECRINSCMTKHGEVLRYI